MNTPWRVLPVLACAPNTMRPGDLKPDRDAAAAELGQPVALRSLSAELHRSVPDTVPGSSDASGAGR